MPSRSVAGVGSMHGSPGRGGAGEQRQAVALVERGAGGEGVAARRAAHGLVAALRSAAGSRRSSSSAGAAGTLTQVRPRVPLRAKPLATSTGAATCADAGALPDGAAGRHDVDAGGDPAAADVAGARRRRRRSAAAGSR